MCWCGSSSVPAPAAVSLAKQICGDILRTVCAYPKPYTLTCTSLPPPSWILCKDDCVGPDAVSSFTAGYAYNGETPKYAGEVVRSSRSGRPPRPPAMSPFACFRPGAPHPNSGVSGRFRKLMPASAAADGGNPKQQYESVVVRTATGDQLMVRRPVRSPSASRQASSESMRRPEAAAASGAAAASAGSGNARPPPQRRPPPPQRSPLGRAAGGAGAAFGQAAGSEVVTGGGRAVAPAAPPTPRSGGGLFRKLMGKRAHTEAGAAAGTA